MAACCAFLNATIQRKQPAGSIYNRRGLNKNRIKNNKTIRVTRLEGKCLAVKGFKTYQ
jgi:hypothetical protein